MQAFAVFVLLGAAVLLLVLERLRADLIAMLVLALLVLLRVLDPDSALSGFSSPATVTVASMFVLSAGLQSSGVVRWLGDRLLLHGPSSEGGLLVLVAFVIGPVSAFLNNTAAVAVFLPVVLRACHGNRISPSRLLMPMAFLAILGGTCTLIGTSTNILVSSLAQQHGLAPFGMFELTPVGLVLFGVGAVYLLLVGRHLLPERVAADDLVEGHHLNPYLSELIVLPDSPLIGSTPAQARLGERYDMEVLGVSRHGTDMHTVGIDGWRLQDGDILLVKAAAPALLRVREAAGIAVRPGRHPHDADLRSAESVLVEAVVAPNSALEGSTLKSVDFRSRYHATALAIRRHGEQILEKIGKVRLRLGDELLVLTPRDKLDRLRRETDFVVLQELDVPVLHPWRALTAALIVAGVVTTAAIGLYPIAVCAISGSVAMVLTGVLPPRKVYDSIDWRVIFLLAGVIPLGKAMETTGAAQQAVETALWILGDFGPQVVLSVFFLCTYLLTGFMSNNATAALMVPLGLTTAGTLGVDSRPFLVAIAFAASAAFYTPVGYQTNLLVYGPGGYRFADYTRVGGPLNVLYWGIATFLIPLLFPF